MSRFRHLALAVAVLALWTIPLACGGSDDTPRETLDNAGVAELESGNVDLTLSVTSGDGDGSNVDLEISGPFRRTKEILPLADLTATATGTFEGRKVDIEAGLTLLSDRAFLNYEGTEYEIDPSTFDLVSSAFLLTRSGPGKEVIYAVDECREAADVLAPADFGSNLTDEGDAVVDGVETTKLSGDFDVSAALRKTLKLVQENRACEAQLEAAGVLVGDLKEIKDELGGGVRTAHIEVYLGEDNIVRKVTGTLAGTPKGKDRKEVEVDFEFTLSNVNEAVEIEGARRAKPILKLLSGFGVGALEAAGLISEPGGLGYVLKLMAADLMPASGN